MIDNQALQQLDYGIGMSINAFITALGMLCENLDRLRNDEALAYPEQAFKDVLDEMGIHHNSIIGRWQK